MAPTDLERDSVHQMQPGASAEPQQCDGCANQQLLSVLAAPAAGAQKEGGSPLIVSADPGQAAFNPFASVGVVMRQSPPIAPQAQAGDWVLPLLVMLAGLLMIARLMRKLVG